MKPKCESIDFKKNWKKYVSDRDVSLTSGVVDFYVNSCKQKLIEEFNYKNPMMAAQRWARILSKIPGFSEEKAMDGVKKSLEKNGIDTRVGITEQILDTCSYLPYVGNMATYGHPELARDMARFTELAYAAGNGDYPPENYDGSKIVALQMAMITISLYRLVVLCGFTLSCGKVFLDKILNKVVSKVVDRIVPNLLEKVMPEVEKFEKWVEENNIDIENHS